MEFLALLDDDRIVKKLTGPIIYSVESAGGHEVALSCERVEIAALPNAAAQQLREHRVIAGVQRFKARVVDRQRGGCSASSEREGSSIALPSILMTCSVSARRPLRSPSSSVIGLRRSGRGADGIISPASIRSARARLAGRRSSRQLAQRSTSGVNWLRMPRTLAITTPWASPARALLSMPSDGFAGR